MMIRVMKEVKRSRLFLHHKRHRKFDLFILFLSHFTFFFFFFFSLSFSLPLHLSVIFFLLLRLFLLPLPFLSSSLCLLTFISVSDCTPKFLSSQHRTSINTNTFLASSLSKREIVFFFFPSSFSVNISLSTGQC